MVTFSVTVDNSASVPSSMSAPTLTGAAGSASLVLASTPDDGGSPITSYEYQVDLAAGDFSAPTVSGTQAPASLGSTITVTPLAEGSYKARSRAVNAEGAGAWSAASANATVTASTGATVLYQQDFTTDRTADFGGDAMTHFPGAEFQVSGFTGWLGTTGGGAMAWGFSDPTITSRQIEVAVIPGQEIEIYWVYDLPTSFDGSSYTVTGVTPRFYAEYLNSSGTVLSSVTLSTPDKAGFYIMAAAPTGATTARIRFQRRATSTEAAPMVIYYAQINEISASGATPVPQNPPRLPWPLPLMGGVGESISYDYADAFTTAIDEIEIVSAPAGLGATVSGTVLTLTPTEEFPASAVFGNTPQEIFIRGMKGATPSLGAQQVLAYAETFPAMSLRPIETIYLEDGHFQVVDPIYWVKGGVWPLRSTITAKPAWLTTNPNGVLDGFATGAVGPQTSVQATVTDNAGNTIAVTVPIEIVAIDRTSPTVIAAADGDIKTATGVTAAAPTGGVFRLVDGDTYELGNWFRVNLPANDPIIIMGPETGTAYINPGFIGQGHGVWIEGNIEFRRTALPTPTADLETNLGLRTGSDWGTSEMKEVYWAEFGEPRSFTRFKGVTFRGFETDLSNETTWRIRDNGSGIFYDFGDPPTGALPTTGPEAIGIYRGGLELSTMSLCQDSVFEACAHPMRIVGPMAGFARNSATKTRVDNVRVQGGDGSVVADNIFSIRTNCKQDEHQDGVQSTSTPQGPCGERVVIKDNFMVDEGWVLVQFLQMNMGSAGSFDYPDDPRLVANDWYFARNVGTATENNAFNPQATLGIMEDNLLVGDPDSNGFTGGGTSVIVRREGSSKIVASRNVFGTLSADTSRSAWTLDGNLIFNGGDATSLGGLTFLDIFPNMATPATYADPREAVKNGAAANTARFWRDDTSGFTQGPNWLSDGLM